MEIYVDWKSQSFVVTFMYFFFNSKIRISIEISIVSIRDHPHFYIV